MSKRVDKDPSRAELREILEEVRRIELVSSRLVTDVMSGGYSSVFRGSGVEFSEVREYVDGDDPRSVDWNVTARLGRPFVKKYVDERELSVLFVVDFSASMDGGFGAWSSRQVAARVCACLGIAAVRNNDKVGMLGFTDQVEEYIDPAKGMGHALRIVRDVLALNPSGRRSNLHTALEFAARVPRKHTVMFVISDFLDENWEESLRHCALRHDVIAVRLTPPETGGVPGGLIRLRDPETETTGVYDWNDSTFSTEFRERTSAFSATTEARLRRAQVDLIDIAVTAEKDRDAIARPIMKFFRMREARGAKR